MKTLEQIVADANHRAGTNVTATSGQFDDAGLFAGKFEGSSPDELLSFLSKIPSARGHSSMGGQVAIRLVSQNPPRVNCYAEFDRAAAS